MKAKKKPTNIFQFPSLVSVPKATAWPRSIVVNSNCDYGWSFGIKRGDTITIQDPALARAGDFVLCKINGEHRFGTFNEGDTIDDLIGIVEERNIDPHFDEEFDVRMLSSACAKGIKHGTLRRLTDDIPEFDLREGDILVLDTAKKGETGRVAVYENAEGLWSFRESPNALRAADEADDESRTIVGVIVRIIRDVKI